MIIFKPTIEFNELLHIVDKYFPDFFKSWEDSDFIMDIFDDPSNDSYHEFSYQKNGEVLLDDLISSADSTLSVEDREESNRLLEAHNLISISLAREMPEFDSVLVWVYW